MKALNTHFIACWAYRAIESGSDKEMANVVSYIDSLSDDEFDLWRGSIAAKKFYSNDYFIHEEPVYGYDECKDKDIVL